MRISMTSRERMLCAMSCQEPDHVPLWNLWRSQEQPFDGRSPQRISIVLGLGLPVLARGRHAAAGAAVGHLP